MTCTSRKCSCNRDDCYCDFGDPDGGCNYGPRCPKVKKPWPIQRFWAWLAA